MFKLFKHLLLNYNLFECLFDKTVQNNVLLFDKKGNVLAINDAFTESFGYELSDVEGAYISIFFTEEDRQAGKPDRELSTVLAEGQCSDNNYLVAKDGTKIWVTGESVKVESVAGDPLILKVIQDIHEKKEAETSLSKLNRFNENILSSIEDAVIVLNPDLKIVKTNRAFFKIFQTGKKDGEDIFFSDLLKHCEGGEVLQQNVMSALKNEKSFSNIPITITDENGEKKTCDVSCSAMHESGANNNVLLVFHDITIHKRIEKEREDVIGFVAHELKNPLANLVLVNELLTDSFNSKEPVDTEFLLSRNKKNIDRLNRMISELYDATRITSGNLKLELSTFDFQTMILEAIDTVQVLQKSHAVEVEADGEIQITADKHRLIQVVTNFLSNAMKYSPSGTTVTIKLSKEEGKVKVGIKDQGMGIAPAQIPYIFDRFFRVDKSKHLEGIGMGLYLCRQIINSHKGKIWVESEEGAGSTFYFSVPVSQVT